MTRKEILQAVTRIEQEARETRARLGRCSMVSVGVCHIVDMARDLRQSLEHDVAEDKTDG